MNKITLRKLTEADLELILEWRNNKSVRENMYTNHIIQKEEHKNWFEKCTNDPSVINLIFERNSVPMGFISFSKINRTQGLAEWAFYSGDVSSRGIGTLMELCALRYAFEIMGLRKLCCEVLSFNEIVIKFHKKFGFTVEGVKKKHYVRDGIEYDIYMLSIFNEDWKVRVSELESKFFKDIEVSL